MLKPHMESEAYHFHFEFGLEILLPLRWHRQSPYNEFHRLQSAFIRKTPKRMSKPLIPSFFSWKILLE